jgi:hypothetical protein
MNNSIENQDCPPLMSDGRHFTDYRPSCYVHDLILTQNKITNSYDLKMLLTHNALKLQKINRNYYNMKNACTSCGQYYIVDPNNHDKYWENYNQYIGYRGKGNK